MDWFNASDDTRIPDSPGKWDTAGIKVEFKIDSKTRVKDLEKSLQTKGAIVVYIGHSALTPGKTAKDPDGPSLGLSPENPKKEAQNFYEQIRSFPRDHWLLRFENRRWKYKHRAAHCRRKLRGRPADRH